MSVPLRISAVELLGRDARRVAGVLDVLAERLARHVDAGEQLEAGLLPGGDAALQIRHVGVAGGGEDFGRALDQAVAVVAQHDAGVAARHQTREAQLQPAQRHRARPQQMAAREDQLLAQIDQRQLAAVGEHRLDGVRIERAERRFRWHDASTASCAGLVPAHPRLCSCISKTWMAGTRPGMTFNVCWIDVRPAAYVACCGVIWCTSPDFRSMRMRLMLSRLMPVTRTKRDLSG